MAPDLLQAHPHPFVELDDGRKLLWAELAASLDGALLFPDAAEFASSTHVFNAGVKSPALAVARPRHAKDVSLYVVSFGIRHADRMTASCGGPSASRSPCRSAAAVSVRPDGAFRARS